MLAVREKGRASGPEKPHRGKAHLIGIHRQAKQSEKRMTGPLHHRSKRITLWLALAAASGGALGARELTREQTQQQQPPPAQQGPPQQTEPPANQGKGEPTAVNLPRGKKLYLKDGSVQVVREYARIGETVRYYSLQESQWEEIPAGLVDWDATAKAEADETAREREFAARIAKQERNREAIPQLDIDASLEVAPGVILPQDEGMFALAGTKVVPLAATRTVVKTDKGRMVEKVFSPIPIVPGRQRVEINGKHSPIRLPSGELQFYFRYNEENAEPTVELVRAHIDGDARRLEWIVSPVTGGRTEQRETISVLKWPIAKGVFRFTVSPAVEPGEYALAVILEDRLNIFVWDFGVDSAPQSPAKHK